VGRLRSGVASDGAGGDASGKPAVVLPVPDSPDFTEGGVCIEPEVVGTLKNPIFVNGVSE